MVLVGAYKDGGGAVDGEIARQAGELLCQALHALARLHTLCVCVPAIQHALSDTACIPSSLHLGKHIISQGATHSLWERQRLYQLIKLDRKYCSGHATPMQELHEASRAEASLGCTTCDAYHNDSMQMQPSQFLTRYWRRPRCLIQEETNEN